MRLLRCLTVAFLSVTALTAVSPANADAGTVPPNLSSAFIIENASSTTYASGGYGVVLCALSTTVSGPTVQLLSLNISPDCLWQQSGPDYDAVLYNAATQTVLDMTTDATGANLSMQPYYTNPLQTYQQWSWSGQTGYGGQALRPYVDSNLDLTNDGNHPAQLWTWDQVDSAPDQTWNRMYLGDTVYPSMPIPPSPFTSSTRPMLLQNAAYPSLVMCADANDSAVYMEQLTASINPYCLWQQGGPSGAPSDAFYLYNPVKQMVLDINSSTSINDGAQVNMQPPYTNPLQSYEWWNWAGPTIRGNYGPSANAMRPYDNTDLNLNGQAPNGDPATGQPLTVTDWNQNRTAMTWGAIAFANAV